MLLPTPWFIKLPTSLAHGSKSFRTFESIDEETWGAGGGGRKLMKSCTTPITFFGTATDLSIHLLMSGHSDFDTH